MLQMLFVCCDEAIPWESQLVLALKTLCGFSTAEIALRLFTSEANVHKRLGRARERLRELRLMSDAAAGEARSRLAGVHAVLYLLFNEAISRRTRAGDPARALRRGCQARRHCSRTIRWARFRRRSRCSRSCTSTSRGWDRASMPWEACSSSRSRTVALGSRTDPARGRVVGRSAAGTCSLASMPKRA